MFQDNRIDSVGIAAIAAVFAQFLAFAFILYGA